MSQLITLVDDHYKELLRSCRGNMLKREHTEPLLNEFLKKFPNYSLALRLRGLIYQNELANENLVKVDDPRFQVIIKSFESSIDADPTNTLALIDLGGAWNDRGNFLKAISYYEEALSLLNNGHYTDDIDEEREDAEAGLSEARERMKSIVPKK